MLTPDELTTPELLEAIARLLHKWQRPDLNAAWELELRAARLRELEHQAQPGRNDLAGWTPAHIMAAVNAPAPKGL